MDPNNENYSYGTEQNQQYVVYVMPNMNMRPASEALANVEENEVVENENMHVIEVPQIAALDEQIQNIADVGSVLDLSIREPVENYEENIAAVAQIEVPAEQGNAWAENEAVEQDDAVENEEQAEVLIVHQQIHADNVQVNEVQVAESDRHVVVEQSSKRIKMYESSDDDMMDDDQKCSICLESWNNFGDHRLCSLRCGHLFGLSCVKKWLEPLRISERRCPECNTKASKKDIRIIYAKKLIAMDTAELEKVKSELKAAQNKIVLFEQSMLRYKIKEQMYEQQLSNLKKRISELECSNKVKQEKQNYLQKTSSFDICPKSGCRVMAYNSWHRLLVATLKSTSQSSSNYGIRKIILDTCSLSSYCNVHSGAIRDLTFPTADPNMCLSVGFDKNVVLTDVRSFIQIHEYKTAANLWSCCWARDDSNFFYVGANNGTILEFDLRYLQSTIKTLENPDDRSPVVSLASVPSFSTTTYGTSGFLACHLNNCYAYVQRSGVRTSSRLDLEGPFISVRYDDKGNHALISCRANSRQQCVRHTVCSIAKDNDDDVRCEVIHTLNGGSTQKFLSRPCHMYIQDDTLVAASNESSSSVLLWSVSSGKQAFAIPVADPVIDTCSFQINNTFLALLTQSKVQLYRHGDVDEVPRMLNTICDT